MNSKSFFKVDSVVLKWSPAGQALLVLAATERDSAQYEGDLSLHLLFAVSTPSKPASSAASGSRSKQSLSANPYCQDACEEAEAESPQRVAGPAAPLMSCAVSFGTNPNPGPVQDAEWVPDGRAFIALQGTCGVSEALGLRCVVLISCRRQTTLPGLFVFGRAVQTAVSVWRCSSQHDSDIATCKFLVCGLSAASFRSQEPHLFDRSFVFYALSDGVCAC